MFNFFKGSERGSRQQSRRVVILGNYSDQTKSLKRDVENSFSTKVDIMWTFTYQNHMFAENDNGADDPYAHFSNDMPLNYEQTSRFVYENSLFEKYSVQKSGQEAILNKKY